MSIGLEKNFETAVIKPPGAQITSGISVHCTAQGTVSSILGQNMMGNDMKTRMYI